MLPFKKIIGSIALVGVYSFASAQLFYNNGAEVAVSGGGILYVDGAVENAHGLFSNAGQTTVRGYFRNGSLATGGGAQGEYRVFGDWENNDVFTADESNVRLDGNAQNITGTQVSTFYDLTLETANTVKTQALDANVNHLLALNDCELATGDNNLNVLNAVNTSITRGSGFVSSTTVGRLTRVTNSTGIYLFPTGWNSNGSVYYRPVEITPSVSTPQSFAVRMAYGDPSNEGYDVNLKAGNVTAVNNKFFHLIQQIGATAPSALSIYYNVAQDGDWGSIGRWQHIPQWEDLMNTTLIPASGNGLSSRTKASWTDGGDEPHVLINAKEVENFFNFPNVFAPGANDPTNQTFHIIDHLNLAEVESMKIFNRWGEPVFDSSRDGKTEWDGNYQGKLQPMGNYVYMASVKISSTGEVKKVSGNLSLLW